MKHPKLGKDWRTALHITNETRYDTRAIRSLVIAALKQVVLPRRGAVRIVYSRATSLEPARRHHAGEAAIGTQVKRLDGRAGYETFQGLTMVLTLPRNPALLDVGHFALVIVHEALHWKGVDHKDMNENQLWCRGPAPTWAEGVTIAHREKRMTDPLAAIAKRRLHAQAMLERSERKAKLAATLVKRWRRRLGAIERAAAKRSAP